MIDRILRAIVAVGLVGLPWLYPYAPILSAVSIAGVGILFWAVAARYLAVQRNAAFWGALLLLGFLGLQTLSLLNRGMIDPGEGYPGEARLVEPLFGWLPGTVVAEDSLWWICWWWGLLGVVVWMRCRKSEIGDATLWLTAFFIGMVITVAAGLLGKGGSLLPGFTLHHGVFQPFGYRNHGVAYAVLGISAGGVMALRTWPSRRWLSIVFAVCCLGALVALPWSQSRFSIIPQIVFGSGLLVLAKQRFLSRRSNEHAVPRVLIAVLVAITAVALFSVWEAGDLTGRMRDTERQIDLVLEGQYPDLRIPAAESALKAGWNRFPWGWGLGSFPAYLPLFAGPAFYAEVYQPETNHFGRLISSPAAHNDLAGWWAEMGAIGISLLFSGLLLLKKSVPGPSGKGRGSLFYSLGVVVLLTFILFDYPMHYPPVTFAGFVFVALRFLTASGGDGVSEPAPSRSHLATQG